ncbi:MAG: phospholipase D-like domain-containing protein, partial [Defluviitaleaceae bacterium]|nr:phospholipase D-like domain-containing protein [Defluviitaleaceae bacterium]
MGKTQYRYSIVKPVMFVVLAVMQAVLYVNIAAALFTAWSEHTLLIPALLVIFLVHVLPVLITVAARQANHSVKLSWLVFVMAFPMIGGVWYELFGGGLFAGRARRIYQAQLTRNLDYLEQGTKVLDELDSAGGAAIGQAYTVLNVSGFPTYKNTRTSILQHGDDFLQILLDELTKAKKFIFIECGALHTGEVFSEVFNILDGKAQEELDIKVIYDKKASSGQLPRGFRQSCEGVGISCRGFGNMAERDNRLMIIIDGNMAFCSTNSSLGDDMLRSASTMYVIRGDAVWSSTVMYLNMWDALTRTNTDYAKFRPTLAYTEEHGHVAVFGDSPANEQHPVRAVFNKMISSAQSHVYIQTPTLEADALLLHTLSMAATSGVDVRVITAALAADALTAQRTRANYSKLLDAGVKIFEYGGALNSNTLICDDMSCLITTASLDYRSMLHNH